MHKCVNVLVCVFMCAWIGVEKILNWHRIWQLFNIWTLPKIPTWLFDSIQCMGLSLSPYSFYLRSTVVRWAVRWFCEGPFQHFSILLNLKYPKALLAQRKLFQSILKFHIIQRSRIMASTHSHTFEKYISSVSSSLTTVYY